MWRREGSGGGGTGLRSERSDLLSTNGGGIGLRAGRLSDSAAEWGRSGSSGGDIGFRFCTGIVVIFEPFTGGGRGVPGGGRGCPRPIGWFRSTGGFCSLAFPFLASLCFWRAFQPHCLAVTAAFATAASVVRFPSPFVEAALDATVLFVSRLNKPLEIEPVALLIEAAFEDAAVVELGSVDSVARNDSADDVVLRLLLATGVRSDSFSLSVASREDPEDWLRAFATGGGFAGVSVGVAAAELPWDLADSAAIILDA